MSLRNRWVQLMKRSAPGQSQAEFEFPYAQCIHNVRELSPLVSLTTLDQVSSYSHIKKLSRAGELYPQRRPW
jgi:hypothetical protein